MKRWHLIAIGLMIYAVAVIVTAPATLVDAGLKRASSGRLRLAEAQGTLWSGSGQIEVRDSLGRAGIANSLAWRLLPESMLRGRLVYEVALDRSPARFPVTISPSRIEIANAEIALPAAVLGMGVPKLAPLGLRGDVLLRIANLSIADREMRGNATLQWRDAGSALTSISPLGDYELRLDCEGATAYAYLRTIQGSLQLEGKGSWTTGNPPVFFAKASVPAQHQQQLGPLLRLIAVDRGEGSFDLQLN